MNAVETHDDEMRRFAVEPAGRVPRAVLSLDPARTDTGSWFLDVRLADHYVSVEWRPNAGFGVTSNAALPYGTSADEGPLELECAPTRTIDLVRARGRTTPTHRRTRRVGWRRLNVR